MKQKSTKRIHWIDQWRGVAALSMIVYHFAFNLNYLELYAIDQHTAAWAIFANFTRISFLLIVGLSLFISYLNSRSYSQYIKRQLRRAVLLFIIALGVTAITHLVLGDDYVRFGILHMIAVGIAVGAAMVRFPAGSFLLALAFFMIGVATTLIESTSPLMLPFGSVSESFQSVDYFPVFPWVGFILLGVTMAHILKSENMLSLKGHKLKWLELIGRHALLIYLVHAPVLYASLWLLTKVN